MSVYTDAQVQIILADYAATDAQGKLNVLGAGIAMFGTTPEGASPPFCVAVVVNVPVKHAGSDYALTVEMHDVTSGRIFQLAGPDGKLQPMRVQQVVPIQPLQLPPNISRPPDALSQHIVVLNFGNGLPVQAGCSYEWRVEIDAQKRPAWWARFHVVGAAAGPIFGGPIGPATIPGVQAPPEEDL